MTLGSGVCYCFGSLVFYGLRQVALMNAEGLKMVTRIDQLKDLSLLLDTASVVLPLIVTVSGIVRSDRPMKCESSGLQCVLLKETTEKHVLKRIHETIVDSEGREKDVYSWKEKTLAIQSVVKKVPWYLDDGTSRVSVVGAQRALDWDSAVRHGTGYYSAQPLPVIGTMDNIWEEMYLEMKRSNPILLTGTPLTVIGEAFKDERGTVQIQKPKNGPFYVSPKNVDEHIASAEGLAGFCGGASFVLAICGIYLITEHCVSIVWRLYNSNSRARTTRLFGAATESEREGPNTTESLRPNETEGQMPADEDVELDNTQLISNPCVVCLAKEYDVVLTPCSHMCCCFDCASKLRNCPLCRQQIEQVVWAAAR